MEDLENIKKDIINFSSEIIEEKINILLGVKLLLRVYYLLPDNEIKKYKELFIGLKGIESQIDHLPLGGARQYWDDRALKEVDKEIEEYIILFREHIFSDCKKIIDAFRGK